MSGNWGDFRWPGLMARTAGTRGRRKYLLLALCDCLALLKPKFSLAPLWAYEGGLRDWASGRAKMDILASRRRQLQQIARTDLLDEGQLAAIHAALAIGNLGRWPMKQSSDNQQRWADSAIADIYAASGSDEGILAQCLDTFRERYPRASIVTNQATVPPYTRESVMAGYCSGVRSQAVWLGMPPELMLWLIARLSGTPFSNSRKWLVRAICKCLDLVGFDHLSLKYYSDMAEAWANGKIPNHVISRSTRELRQLLETCSPSSVSYRNSVRSMLNLCALIEFPGLPTVHVDAIVEKWPVLIAKDLSLAILSLYPTPDCFGRCPPILEKGPPPARPLTQEELTQVREALTDAFRVEPANIRAAAFPDYESDGYTGTLYTAVWSSDKTYSTVLAVEDGRVVVVAG